MYKKCTTERTAKQQKVFEKCLLELMSVKPYTDISITELCQKALLSRYTFYRLFERKDDVLDAIVDRALLGSHQHQSSDMVTDTNFYESNIRFFSYWKEQEQLLDALNANGKSTLLIERCLDYLLTVDDSIADFFRAEESGYSEQVMQFCMSGVFMLIINWHRSGFQRSVEEMADSLEMLLRRPIAYPKEIK